MTIHLPLSPRLSVLFTSLLFCACNSDDGNSDDSVGTMDTVDSNSTIDADSDDSDSTSDMDSGSDTTSTETTATTESTETTDSTDSGGDGVAVDLGEAENFVILAKSGVSTVPPSVVVGNVGLSPAAATFLTGFSLSLDATNTFATSPQVTGQLFASDYAPPTPAQLTAAVGAMELAFTDAAGRPADVTELGAGDIGGMTLEPGVYAWGTSLIIPTDLTLSGNDTDQWIMQIAGDLTLSSGVEIVLSGGAQARNVVWQVDGLVELGTTSHAEGIVLTQTSITLKTGASIEGRLLAQTAVDLDAATVIEPAN